MNRYRNTFKMYRSRFQPIPDNTGVLDNTGHFGRKKEIWPVQKLKGKIEEMHDLNKPSAASCHHIDIADWIFFFLFFFLLFLVCCPCPLLWFLLFFCWTMNIVMWYLFFCLVSCLKFLKPFYTWLALEMWKTYIFLIKDGLNGLAFYLLFGFEPHVMWCINCITSIEPYSFRSEERRVGKECSS